MTGKVTGKDGTVILTEVYTYKESNGQPTTQVASHTTQNAAGTVVSSYTYSYDANGNITQISDVTTATHYTTTYRYDSANQLIRENNQRRGTTWTWEYDNAGNILSRTEYAYTTAETLTDPVDTVTYDYDDSAWGDLLTTYDGSAITYDVNGNPLDDGTWEYTWEHGRQLASMTNAGSDPLDETTVTYTYDADGMRTGKTVVHSYHTHSYASAVTAPTCTEAGYTTHVCASCGDSYVDSATQATGHSYTSTVTPPTCVEEGYTTHTCAACGDSYTDSPVPVTDHSGYTVSTVAPTCTEDGSEEYYCETCGCLYSVTLPATGHNGSFLIGEPATCTEDGYEDYLCSTCGEHYSVTIPATGHTMSGGLVPWCVVCNYNRPGDPIFWSLRSDTLLNTVETTSYSYVYNGGQLSQMTVTTVTETADGQTTTQTHTVDLTYDASGNPQTMTYDGVTYYYTVNIQGDVTGILDESGTVLVRYNYQAYGTTYYYGAATGSVGATLVKINPLTYRGYVYDRETKLYYLQSRYYNRTSGRFINADAFTSTGQGLLGNNMFAYCGNNPVKRTDSSGMFYTNTYAVCIGETKQKEYSYVELAYAIGQRCTISEGTISIDMTQEADLIFELLQYASLHDISFVIAVACCNKYYDTYGEEFLLSDMCVAYEIEEHIAAYYWSTGKKALPNLLAVGYGAYQIVKRGSYIEGSVYDATRTIDMRESDVAPGNMQAVVFGYMYGIRKKYIGSSRDPWANYRQGGIICKTKI